MATDHIVGIDLGTTNSLVAFMQGDNPVVIPGDDGSNLVPSVVALDRNGQPIVGNASLRPKFPRSFCASSSATPNGSSGLRS